MHTSVCPTIFSRNHCLLEINPPHSFLRDLGSTNGTFVNSQRVREAALKSGDRIQCGETIVVVEVTAGDDVNLSRRPRMPFGRVRYW